MQDKILKSFNSGNLTTADSLKLNKVMPYEMFENYTTIEFENHQFMTIKKYDEYLKTIYGDYMQLPPVDKRTTHLCDFVDCHKSFEYYLKNKKEIK